VSEQKPAAIRYALPAAAGMATVAVLNGLWSSPDLKLYDMLPHAYGVYLPSALVALALLWWTLRLGTVTNRDVGLDTSGWTAPRRLLALAMILFMGYGGYATLELSKDGGSQTTENLADDSRDAGQTVETAPAVEKPSWGDYCFWFVFLLSASLVELLVFVCLGFCLPEKWLKEKTSLPPWSATVLAALFAAFMFGIYHYTHEPRFHDYVYSPLMPVMLLNLTCFIATRNFHLTLILHNSFAAVGFTQEQWGELAKPSPAVEYTVAHYLNPAAPLLPALIISFVAPYLLLLWIEYKHQRLPHIDAPTAHGG